ncbi:sugar ABC transporter substrate-binding protein [Saccharospirillum alexandrii]|uniref:sugar ABC transporter substrate-binding protein n=1 Tax=Saccharospirillum alexandrii TaxID=2448477 RepID=UPI000FDBB168|nr:sugar ABC transporter substrate-binding protein [Saccharospirillum alexandrii]
MKASLKTLTLAMGLSVASGAAMADDILIGLITKTNTNPFFVKMKEGAEAQAAQHGNVELRSFAGRFDGDNDSQVQAIENLISAGAKGILITPNDSEAIVPAVQQARDAGIVVIALDTPLSPANSADATFATDNFKAGELIGQWARAQAGDSDDAKIALLDLNSSEISVDVARNQGFLQGFGIDLNDPQDIGDEDDDRIVGNDVTQGSEEGGRRAMENLLQRDPSLNLVYTINEPAAAGAYEALKAVGLADQVKIVSVDGGCPGVENVAAGVIGATSMQFPLKMASLGVDAIVTYAESGVKPGATPGLDFFNTGVTLVTDQPVDGIDSISSEDALTQCWG